MDITEKIIKALKEDKLFICEMEKTDQFTVKIELMSRDVVLINRIFEIGKQHALFPGSKTNNESEQSSGGDDYKEFQAYRNGLKP